jgi:hypothetical protein
MMQLIIASIALIGVLLLLGFSVYEWIADYIKERKDGF